MTGRPQIHRIPRKIESLQRRVDWIDLREEEGRATHSDIGERGAIRDAIEVLRYIADTDRDAVMKLHRLADVTDALVKRCGDLDEPVARLATHPGHAKVAAIVADLIVIRSQAADMIRGLRILPVRPVDPEVKAEDRAASASCLGHKHCLTHDVLPTSHAFNCQMTSAYALQDRPERSPTSALASLRASARREALSEAAEIVASLSRRWEHDARVTIAVRGYLFHVVINPEAPTEVAAAVFNKRADADRYADPLEDALRAHRDEYLARAAQWLRGVAAGGPEAGRSLADEKGGE